MNTLSKFFAFAGACCLCSATFAVQRPLSEASVSLGQAGAFTTGGSPAPNVTWLGGQSGTDTYTVTDIVDGQVVTENRSISWIGYDWAMSYSSTSYNNNSPHNYNGYAERNGDWITVNFYAFGLLLKAKVEVRYYVYADAYAGGESSDENCSGTAYAQQLITVSGDSLQKTASIAISGIDGAVDQHTTGTWVLIRTNHVWVEEAFFGGTGGFQPLGSRGDYIANSTTQGYGGRPIHISTTGAASGKVRVTAAVVSVETLV